MFPMPVRDSKYVMGMPYLSPIEKTQIYRPGQLPQFKKIPHNKYYSQQRKRFDKFDIKQLSNPIVSPKNKNSNTNRSFFFKNNEQQIGREQSPNINDVKNTNSSILKVNKDSKNRKYVRHVSQQNQASLRQITDHRSYNHNKQGYDGNKLRIIDKPNQEQSITPLQVLKSKHNLEQYQKQQIVSYGQIYYYGQNCTEKRKTLLELNKKQGGYNWLKGDHIHFRYQIFQCLGQGSFGEVFKCFDHKNKKQVALKIIKSNEKYISQAKVEIKILNYIKGKDPSGFKNCVHLRDHFMFRDRMCMVFDLMSINLYELIKNNKYYGLPLDLIRRIALQVLNALNFLHKCQIIHADLKPENIILKQANKSGIKVIDFGSSCFQNETIYTYIQSRYYRAPQVILGIPYNRKIDIWSFGCVMAELYLGYPLFAGDQQHQQMCYLIQTLGYPPNELMIIAKRTDVFFDRNSQLKSHPKKAPQFSKPLSKALQNPKDKDFVDFIRMCLEWTPEKRCQATSCLRHEWILKGLPEEIRKQHLKALNDEQEKKLSSNHQKNRSFSLNQQRNKLFH